MLRSAQRAWADRRQIRFNRSDRVNRLEDNLFQAMNPDTRSEFESGDGSELGTPLAPGSMFSLISSSALCCNAFDAWRGQPLSDLATSLGIDRSYTIHRFESKHPTGLRGKAPNLDVELRAPGLKPIAIESKFVEPYRPAINSFKRPYFSNRALWIGLESWRRLAVAIHQGERAFPTLHVAQLIKHALGLAHRYGPDGFTLLYLWYRVPGPAGDAHELELERLGSLIGDAVDFRTIAYVDVLSRVTSGPHGWIEYMTERYGLV